MARIGVVNHSEDPDARSHATALATDLCGRGHLVVAVEGDLPDATPVQEVAESSFAADLDLVVSMGGDGTILRAVRLLAGAPVDILGVNFGSLGYLTAVEPDGLFDAVDRSLVTDMAADRVARIRRVCDKASIADNIHDGINASRLRVRRVNFDEFRHARIVGEPGLSA